MLIALFTILFLGGGGAGILDFVADAQDEIKVVMEKDNQQREALGILKAMKKRVSANNKTLKLTLKDLDRALSTDADFDTIWDTYFEQRGAHNRDMLDLRFKLRDQLTREEWEQVFSPN